MKHLLVLILLTALPRFIAGETGDLNKALAEQPGVVAKIVEQTAGSRTRAVWVRTPAMKGPHTDNYRGALVGFDSKTAKLTVIHQQKGFGYTRPNLTCDGKRVVFTSVQYRGQGRGRSKVYVVPFAGGRARLLVDGAHCTDIRHDPASGKSWAYVVNQPKPNHKHGAGGSPLWRVDLDNPERKHVLWQKTGRGNEISWGYFQVTGDGRYGIGAMSGRTIKRLDFKTGTATKIGKGCWPAVCPDDSGIYWIFPGSHDKLPMRRIGADGGWSVELKKTAVYQQWLRWAAAKNQDSKNKRRGIRPQFYYPKWSTNDPRLIVFAGPITGFEGAPRNADFYIARLTPDLRAVEAAAQITADNFADVYPDVWVERPHELDMEKIRRGAAARKTPAATPMRVKARLLVKTDMPRSVEGNYTRALAAYEFEIQEVLAGKGLKPKTQVAGFVWAMQKRQPVPTVCNMKTGQVYTLAIDRFDAYPNLESERQFNGLDDLDLPQYIVREIAGIYRGK